MVLALGFKNTFFIFDFIILSGLYNQTLLNVLHLFKMQAKIALEVCKFSFGSQGLAGIRTLFVS